uniref:Uncharacterized protein n=1 Tax=Monodelphis domestica TaxID=13616 RepID=A0A5F8H413_MONDO
MDGHWQPGRFGLLLLLDLGLGGLFSEQVEAQKSVGTPPERNQPYPLLHGQNLVLMRSIFSIVLVTILMAMSTSPFAIANWTTRKSCEDDK